MSTTQRKRRGGTTNSRQSQKRERLVGPTTEMTSEAEPIELVESAGEEVVDLTCESTEPVVVDLTHNDSVVFVEENRRQRRNPRISRGQPDSCVLSSDDEETRDNDVYVTENPPRGSVVLEETSSIRILKKVHIHNYTFDKDETLEEVSNQTVKLAQESELEVDENTVGNLIGSHGEDLTKEHLIELLSAEERKALKPKVKPKRPSGTVSCPICMDGYSEILQSGRLIVSTKCGHVFCSQCLRDALRNASSCPTCRKKLNQKQYHPIYI